MRSYRDLWLWLGGLFLVLVPFPAAIAIAYYAKLTHHSVLLNWWMLASLMFFLAAFICFLGAIKGLRFPPWKRVRFPDIKVDIYGEGDSVTDRVITLASASSALVTRETLRTFRVRIVNMEAEQNASLTVRLYVKLAPGSFGNAIEMICTPLDWALSPTAPQALNPIQMPIVLQPGMARGGDLPYVLARYLNFASPFSAELELDDHVTNKPVRIPARMGKFDKTTMVPATGAIAFSQEQPETSEAAAAPGSAQPTDSASQSTETQTDASGVGGRPTIAPPPSS
ncbi:MAG: hypothetical protein M3Y27_03535 [Acidobacteriota bacterium]|nr:hypothetical protein [Acidobacteriota bacterium]